MTLQRPPRPCAVYGTCRSVPGVGDADGLTGAIVLAQKLHRLRHAACAGGVAGAVLTPQVTGRRWSPCELGGIDVPSASDAVNVRRMACGGHSSLSRFAFPSGQAFLALHGVSGCSSTPGDPTTAPHSGTAPPVSKPTGHSTNCSTWSGSKGRRDPAVASRKQVQAYALNSQANPVVWARTHQDRQPLPSLPSPRVPSWIRSQVCSKA